MTSVTLTHTSRTRLRMTTRGRRVLAFLAALPVAAIIATAVVNAGPAVATREEGVSAESFQRVTVGEGDSLWSIAQVVAPDSDPRDVVDEMMRLNSLPSSMVQAGQELAIPLEYTGSLE